MIGDLVQTSTVSVIHRHNLHRTQPLHLEDPALHSEGVYRKLQNGIGGHRILLLGRGPLFRSIAPQTVRQSVEKHLDR